MAVFCKATRGGGEVNGEWELAIVKDNVFCKMRRRRYLFVEIMNMLRV